MIDYYDLLENIFEDIFDTDVYRYYAEKEGKKVAKYQMSDEEKRRVDTMLAIPDARPAEGDRTVEAWLLRISIWGKLKLIHNNPDEKIKNQIMTIEQFLNYLNDQRRNAIYGKWTVDNPKIDLVKITRKFYSFLLDKEIVEELIVEIDLREDLKAILKQTRKSMGLLGMFN
jgi:hypothetical protein